MSQCAFPPEFNIKIGSFLGTALTLDRTSKFYPRTLSSYLLTNILFFPSAFCI